ncbi:MAG TPA: hypothetical protein ENG44_03580 [Desulfurococcaceae archaeon]|nr:hypothetical protein [Desulfurococcaceae archaeon]
MEKFVEETLPIPRELDPVLMNPKRFLIASLLYMLGPQTMSFIQKALKIPWGPLYTHLKRMEDEGYVRTRRVITPLGPRTMIELTERGIEAYKRLLNELQKITSLHMNSQRLGR